MQTSTRSCLAVLIVIALALFLVACVVGGGLYLWARQEGLNPVTAIRLKIILTRNEDTLTSPAGSDERFREFEVQPGDSPYAIGLNLLAEGLITDADLFVDYARYHGLDRQLEAGIYYLQQTQTMEEIAYALTDASVASIQFRTLAGLAHRRSGAVRGREQHAARFFRPGISERRRAGRADPAGIQGADGHPRPAEQRPAALAGRVHVPGRLPASSRASRRSNCVMRCSRTFNDHVTGELYQQATAQDLTMYEVVTLASIVQREAAVTEEMGMIASVYLNRLRLPMRLDADPTVQYAIGNTREPGNYWPQITQADYYGLSGVPNQSYSTYLNEGLPPGPIASPSLAAILAVLNPPVTEYFYFRLGCDGDGRHVFFTLNQQSDHANFTCP